MKKLSCVAAALILLGGCSYGPRALLEEASNATSQVVCSGVFVSDLAPDEVYRLEMRPEPGMGAVNWALRYDVDGAGREVSTHIAGAFDSHSVFREGRGCTLIFREPPPEAIRPVPSAPAVLPDIAGSEVVVPASTQLRTAIDEAFAEPAGGAPRATGAVVVVHHGRVIGERYALGIGVDTALDGHSLAKSVVNALTGVLVREKRLDVSARVNAPEWNVDDPRAQITIDNLMRMDAGFDFDEGRGPGAATYMWYTQDDTASFAAQQPLVSPVGTQWHYSSGSYAILSGLLRNTIGGPQALNDFVHREIFDPLGMRHVTIDFDGVGNMMGSQAVYAPARDWAKFGLLFLNDGVVGGQRILPEGWVRYSTRPTLDSGYGAGFWLNSADGQIPTWGIPWGLPGAPSDAFMGRGYMGQWVVVVPSEDLVVVRMGFSHGDAGEMTSVAHLVRDVVRALHATP